MVGTWELAMALRSDADCRTMFNHSSFFTEDSDVSRFISTLRERVRFVTFFPAAGSVGVAATGEAPAMGRELGETSLLEMLSVGGVVGGRWEGELERILILLPLELGEVVRGRSVLPLMLL